MWEERLPPERCHHLPSRQGQGEPLSVYRNHCSFKVSCWKMHTLKCCFATECERDDYPLPVLTSSHCRIVLQASYKSVSFWCWHYKSLSSLCVWCTFLFTTAFITGTGLLCTERPAGLFRAQGDVCVSHFLFFVNQTTTPCTIVC